MRHPKIVTSAIVVMVIATFFVTRSADEVYPLIRVIAGFALAVSLGLIFRLWIIPEIQEGNRAARSRKAVKKVQYDEKCVVQNWPKGTK